MKAKFAFVLFLILALMPLQGLAQQEDAIPPRVIDHQPAGGAELPLDGVVEVFFSQPMDRESVEAAFAFGDSARDVQGDFTWLDDTALQFKPAEPLERAVEYSVTIEASAAAQNGATLPDPYRFTVQTTGYLEVGQVMPSPDSTGVDVDSILTVVFTRPVVPLVIVEEMDDLPDPLTLDPPVEGEGEWLNTSIYVFTPENPLAGGTTYTATVEAGLEDAIGGVMEEPYNWSFTTIAPIILETSPRMNQERVPLDEPIEVTFNQPMNQESVEAAFSLVDTKTVKAIEGTFGWNDKGTQFAFTSDELLNLQTTYRVTLEGSAVAAGGMALEQGQTWEFSTVPYPAIVDTNPRDGEQRASPRHGFDIFFNTRMDEDTLEDKVTVEPEPDEVNYYYNTYDERYTVSFYMEPAADYTVTIEPGMADIYGNTIDEGMVVQFTTGDLSPEAYLNVPAQVGLYSAYAEDTRLFSIYRNISQLDFALYDLSRQEIMRLTGPDNWEMWDTLRTGPNVEQPLRDWSVPLEGERNTRSYQMVYPNGDEGGALAPGLYFLRMSTPDMPQRSPQPHALIVGTVNITTKVAIDEAFVWVSDLNSGEPVGGVEVILYGQNRQEITRGNTNAEGVFTATIPDLENLYENVYAFVDDGEHFGYTTSYWANGIDPWSFGLNANYYPVTETSYLYTDRPIYRPGQPVYFRGVLRDRDDVTYTVPDEAYVSVFIENPRGETVYREDLDLSAFGTFSGEFTLDDETDLGYYQIGVEYRDNTYWLGFGVAEYRLPEFTVSVLPEKDEVVQSETINVEVDSSFYFGGPVSNADVRWAVLSQPYSFNYTGEGYWDFTDYNYDAGPEDYYPGYGGKIADGEGATDERGRFTFEMPADISQHTQSQEYTIDVTVTDVSDQTVSNRARVIVHQGEVYLGLRPDRYVSTAEEESTINLITVDWDSEPAPGQTVELTAYKRNWSNVKEEDENGITTWHWEVEEIEVASGEVTTDDEGAAAFTFTPEDGGVYKVLATTRDSLGNEVRSSTFVWVSGRRYVSWRQQNSNRIELIPDRQTDYQVGDEAEILITSPFQGETTALVTVERAGVIQYELIQMDTNSHIYKLPITADHIPNIFVSVFITKGVDEDNPIAGFRMGAVRLAVATDQKELNVEVTPSAEKAQPGETVTYDIKVTDYKGDPVSAEVGLSLTDQAALDIASPNSGKLLDHFYGLQGLATRTATPLTLFVDQLTQETLDTIKGGGGGGGGGAFEVREDFIDTPYWNAHVVTDADGKASVEVKLPDNLTTWNMDARALTKDTLVGQTTVDIVSTKPVLIRPVTPRFLVEGDEVVLGAVVHNNTDEAMDIEVSLAEAVGLDVQDDLVQTVSLEPEARTRVNWRATVLPVDAVTLIFAAEGDGYQDASRPTLGRGDDQAIPVLRYETPETVGTAGVLREGGTSVEAVVLPRTMEVERGELTVRLDPSLAAATVDGLDYLKNYPYQCTEQTVSRFYPNVVAYRALETLGLSDSELEEALREQVNWAVQRLYAQQHVDGGWGWWINDDSNPTVTAYALLGLVEARDAGFEISGSVVENATRYLKSNLEIISTGTATYKLNRQAFMLYTLARVGAGDVARSVLLFDLRERLNYDARAYLAMAFSMMEGTDRARVEAILSDLNNAAITSATGAHWEEDYRDRWNWSSDTRTTAIVLMALARLDPENAFAPNAVRWLMVAREADNWETTQETAWAVMALTDWMLVTGELEADYDYSVALNGDELAAGEVTPERVRETETLRVEVADLLKDEANRLAVSRSEGPGVLYYTAHMRVFLPVEEVEPLNRGIILERRYTIDGEPVNEARVNDTVDVTLTIIAPHDLYYVVVEDPIPAGTEIVNTSLLTTSAVGQRPTLSRADPLSRGWGWWWFSHTQARDEKVVMSATRLPRGTYTYKYQVRVGLEGVYKVMPPVGWEFYFPEVYGRGAGSLFTVLPEAEE